MLYLLSSPAWASAGQTPEPLPLTLPAALLVVLATQAGWMPREQLALVFWPDAPPTDALHHLRINLHRARQLLQGWGLGDALLAERSRVQLALPSDIAQLRAAQASGDVALLQRLSPAQWLSGWRLPGYDGFAQWCDDTAQQLQDDWLAAGRRYPDQASSASFASLTIPAGGLSAPASALRLPAPPQAPPGRESELERLLASPAPALVLQGEPGAGKSTLLRAAWPQAPCLRGLEGLHGMPYRPLLDALRAHGDALARALRSPHHPLRPYRLDLARVLPELAPDEPLPPLDALTAQTRLIEAMARAMEALSPVLLVDDLQWCDSATVDWLLMLGHSGRLRWRAALRQHEVAAPLAQALNSLRSAARLETLELAPLGRTALAAACQQRWPEQAFTPSRLDQLHSLSGGNAFMLGELVAAGLGEGDPAAVLPVTERIAQLVRARLQALPELAQRAVEAAAVFVQPVPAQALQHLVGLAPADVTAGQAGSADTAWQQALGRATAAGLLRAEGDGLCCRHDLIRQAIAPRLPAARTAALHRHAALWLASQVDADALTIAEHWRAAAELQTALAWWYRAADRLKSRGGFEAARALWHQVADQSQDAALALRARLELAACDLFDDLARGRLALEAVQAQLPAVADARQRGEIEGQVLAALVDNRVFAGDIASAVTHAQRLQALLPELPMPERCDALEVLIELSMRQPDIPGAWALLAQLRTADPKRPTLLSYEGQIHWFGGQVQAAHDALARLLARHPDYCRGITIENDLAVMLQALGRIGEAEAMARRSLHSWAGVAHTETLSLLVLGLVLTSAGQHAQADAALQRALAMAREQASAGFEAEALVRRARLLLQCGRVAAAQQALDAAAPLLAGSPEPLRVSQLVLVQVLAASAAGQPLRQAAIDRLQAVAAGSQHPLVQARLARVHCELALVDARSACNAGGAGEGTAADALATALAAALAAALAQADAARQGPLPDLLAEAWLLQARARQWAGEPVAAWRPLLAEAADVAGRCGLAELRWRACHWLAELEADAPTGSAGDEQPAQRAADAARALTVLLGAEEPALFDAAAATLREPRCP